MRFFTVFIALIISVSIFGNSQTPFAFMKRSSFTPTVPVALPANYVCEYGGSVSNVCHGLGFNIQSYKSSSGGSCNTNNSTTFIYYYCPTEPTQAGTPYFMSMSNTCSGSNMSGNSVTFDGYMAAAGCTSSNVAPPSPQVPNLMCYGNVGSQKWCYPSSPATSNVTTFKMKRNGTTIDYSGSGSFVKKPYYCPSINAISTLAALTPTAASAFSTVSPADMGDGTYTWQHFETSATYKPIIGSILFGPAAAVYVSVSDQLLWEGGFVEACTPNPSLPAPSITSISPTSALTDTGAGTLVSIYGSNFKYGSTVSIGGSTCTSPTVAGNRIQCTTSAHAQGLANVVVSNPVGETVTLTNGYTYNLTPPSLAAENFKCWLVTNDVNSSGFCGPVATTVIPTINFPGFGAQSYQYPFSYYCPTSPTTQAWNTGGTSSLCNLLASSNDNITLSSGGPLYKQSGSPDLAIEKDATGLYTSNWNGSNCTNTWYSPPCSTYTNASIASISPTSAITATGAGTAVTINGDNFRAGSTVSIGGSTCTSPTVYKTKIYCTTSAHAQGLTDVVVTSPSGGGGNVTLTNGYTYNVANVAFADDAYYGPMFHFIAPVSEYGKTGTLDVEVITGFGFITQPLTYNKRAYCSILSGVRTAHPINTLVYISYDNFKVRILSPSGMLLWGFPVGTAGAAPGNYNIATYRSATNNALATYDDMTSVASGCTITP